MIYLDACALLKLVRLEPETAALRAWRQALPRGTELVTSELAQLEITRTLLAALLTLLWCEHRVDTVISRCATFVICQHNGCPTNHIQIGNQPTTVSRSTDVIRHRRSMSVTER